MLVSPRTRRFSRALLPLFLGSALSLASAQGTKSKKPASGNEPAPLPIPLLVGVGVGGLVVGSLLGAGLKKAPPPVVETQKDPVFEVAPSALAVIDNKERVTRANAAWHALLGTQPSQNEMFAPLLHPDDLAPVRVALLSIFDGETPFVEHKARFFRPDGTLVSTRLVARKQGEKAKPDSILVGLSDQSELVESTRELDGARTAIRALYDVMATDKNADLDAKIKSLLAMGCGRLELPIGALSRLVRQEDGHDALETLFVQSLDRRVRPALVLARSDRSFEAHMLGLNLLPEHDEWRDMPCVASSSGGTYFGAPVEVSGQWFGMLSFSSPENGRSGFDASEVELLGLMAQWVGSEIEREEAKAAVIRQQNEILAANQKLEALATIDPLTEAKNRRAFNDKLAEEWARSTRYGTPLSLVLLDVDKFKSYNDTFGHPAGDEVLKRVARVLMAAVRGTDFCARYGGEEFALILPNTDMQGALILAERLRARVEAGPWKEREVTASFGVTTLDDEIKTTEAFINSADEALYASKERGRNRVTHALEMAAAAV